MKFRKLIHHILVTIGLALGIIATGTTVNAKAQQLNPNNTENNNPSSNQNINNNQLDNSANVLINVPQQNRDAYNQNDFNNNYYNNGYLNNKFVPYNSNPSYSQFNHYDQNDYQNPPTYLGSAPANLSNYNSEHDQINLNSTNNSAEQLYKSILLNASHHFNDEKEEINHSAKYRTQNIVKNAVKPKLNNPNTHKMKLSGTFGQAKQHSIQPIQANHKRHHQWFRDGLSRQNLKARSWVSWHESNHRWRVLSYGGVCVGYFQLSPSYLGYRHGHVNLNKKHQVKVADAYVRGRYGNWVNAKRFWETHHWY